MGSVLYYKQYEILKGIQLCMLIFFDIIIEKEYKDYEKENNYIFN